MRQRRHHTNRLTSRPALRQAMGVLVLALFARQTTAMAWMMVPDATAGTMAGVTAPSAAHHHMPTAPKAPAAPRHDSGCDGNAPAACCAIGSGCAVVAMMPPVAWTAPRLAPPSVLRAVATSPRWRSISPADPPPRS